MRREPRGRAAAIQAGPGPVGWIAVQVAIIGYVLVRQPVMYLLGAAIVLIAPGRPRPRVASAA